MDDKNLQRIDGIIKHINTVQGMIDGISFKQFKENIMMVNAVSFSIAQIGERMVKLEELLSSKYPFLPWEEARRMRNIIVHDYDHSDPKTVFETAVNDLPILKQHFFAIKDDIKHISDNSIETNRLIIRPWDDLDADELFELAKEPEIGFWCGFEPHKSIKDSLFVLHNFLEIKGAFAVCLKENGRIVGSIGLHFKEDTYLTSKDDECELGYWIGMPYWRNGYATEAVTRVLEYAFADLNVSTIWSSHYDGNYKSKSVLEKLGFVFHHISSGADINKTKMTHIYKLTKEKWISLNK